MSDSVSFRDFRGVEGQVDDASNPPTPTEVKKAVSTLRRSNGVSVEQALRSERPAAEDEGTRSFGAPLSTPDPATRQRPAQSTDSQNGSNP